MNDEENCTNKAWLDKWKPVELTREGDVATTRQATEAPILDHDTASYIADLASKGSTVAIAAEDDPVYDFYLLQVTSDGVEELDSNVTDDYQCHYYRGDRVLKGHFYIRENIHDMTFTIDEKRKAFVHAATVRHICGDLPVRKRGRKSIYKLPLKENEEIIALMWTNNYKTLFFHFYIDFLKILWKTKNVPRPQGIVGNTKISVINAK